MVEFKIKISGNDETGIFKATVVVEIRGDKQMAKEILKEIEEFAIENKWETY